MSVQPRKPSAPPPPSAPAPAGDMPADAPGHFSKRHPKIANAIFAVLCVYVAMLWLLALDQAFHWGIFGPKIPPLP